MGTCRLEGFAHLCAPPDRVHCLYRSERGTGPCCARPLPGRCVAVRLVRPGLDDGEAKDGAESRHGARQSHPQRHLSCIWIPPPAGTVGSLVGAPTGERPARVSTPGGRSRLRYVWAKRCATGADHLQRVLPRVPRRHPVASTGVRDDGEQGRCRVHSRGHACLCKLPAGPRGREARVSCVDLSRRRGARPWPVRSDGSGQVVSGGVCCHPAPHRHEPVVPLCHPPGWGQARIVSRGHLAPRVDVGHLHSPGETVGHHLAGVDQVEHRCQFPWAPRQDAVCRRHQHCGRGQAEHHLFHPPSRHDGRV